MIEQYPSELYVWKSQGGGVDDDGFVIPSTPEWIYHSKCREIAAGAGNIVATTGGEVTNYASKVVMPLGTPEISVNSKIQVRNGEKVVIEANVIRFAEKQLHCRLWV